MRILFTTLGSGGDLIPYLAIARELAARGHAPALATSAHHRAGVEGRGVAFHPVRPDVDVGDETLLARTMAPRRGPVVGLREILMPALHDTYEDTLAAARDADAIVSHPIAYAAPLVAEITGLPWISTALAPFSFFSRHDLPVIPMAPRLKWIEPLPGARRALLRLYERTMDRWIEPVRALRAELGLPPPDDDADGRHSPLLALGLFSPAFARPQPDWPASAQLTGFPFDDLPPPANGDSRRLEAFLAAGPPPIVFTLGTSVVRTAGSFYHESLAAARLAGVRAVLLVGDEPGNQFAEPLGDDVIALARAPYHALFPRAAAVVHHGGIGTVGEALRAGRPMLVVPRSHDQPDNAHRARRLGVARVLLRPRPYRARRVAHALRALIEDPSYAERAAELAAALRREDGVGAACDAIEAAAGAG